jgi:hypothetical protein
VKTFVVRLNPDPRNGDPYSKFVSKEEYAAIHNVSPMDGFHEAVNFLSEGGVVRGYLPPRHSKAMRSGEPFVLITITAKTAKIGGDQIIGIQAGCVYEGETTRQGASHKQGLTCHFRCPASRSYIFPQPIPNARALVLGNNGNWVRGPTYELSARAFRRLIGAIEKNLKPVGAAKAFSKLMEGADQPIRNAGFEEDLSFEQRVKEEFNKSLENVKGNSNPSQKEVRTYQYERDPRVVAYVLKKAQGICSDCNKEGPFISKTTGLPFLEVHHVHMLKNGGPDTVKNAIALCPNCHRGRHYG